MDRNEVWSLDFLYVWVSLLDKQRNLKKWSTMIRMTYSPIDTSCEAIKHQSTIARFGDSLDKKRYRHYTRPFWSGRL